MTFLTARGVLNRERHASDHKNHPISHFCDLLVQLPKEISITAAASKRGDYSTTNFVRNDNDRGFGGSNRFANLMKAPLDFDYSASLGAHDVV